MRIRGASPPAKWALVALVAGSALLCVLIGARIGATQNTNKKPIEGLIVEPDVVTPDQVEAWKREGFQTLVLVLDERFDAAIYKRAADAAASRSLDLYYWIEVGRNPKFADEHPEWMASFGMHDDWRRHFPDVPPLREGEVAKVWPWTPIAYRDAFDAHLERITTLLERVPSGFHGLLVNDLQGGPSSCGCGNLQCRWAIDYGVPATAEQLPGHDVAAKFMTELRKLVPNKLVVPVWMTECEEHDMAAEKLPAGVATTGYCGGVDCFHYCRDRFTEQWTALHATHRGPTALLALHKELQRDGKEYGATANWITSAEAYVSGRPNGQSPRPPLWLIVQGYDVTIDEEAAARRAAAATEPAAVLVARARIDQSFEPRIVPHQEKQRDAAHSLKHGD